MLISATALSSLRPVPASLATRPFGVCRGGKSHRLNRRQPTVTRAKLGGGGEGPGGLAMLLC